MLYAIPEGMTSPDGAADLNERIAEAMGQHGVAELRRAEGTPITFKDKRVGLYRSAYSSLVRYLNAKPLDIRANHLIRLAAHRIMHLDGSMGLQTNGFLVMQMTLLRN